MNKLEEKMVFAVKNKKTATFANTNVFYNKKTNISSVFLHGNQIGSYDHHTSIMEINNCGWITKTTKSRLNALGASIRQKNFRMLVTIDGIESEMESDKWLSIGVINF